jgi:hypothetical protein
VHKSPAQRFFFFLGGGLREGRVGVKIHVGVQGRAVTQSMNNSQTSEHPFWRKSLLIKASTCLVVSELTQSSSNQFSNPWPPEGGPTI